MKGKLRRITVDDNVYVYIISDVFDKETRATKIIIRIFLNEQKGKPLIIHLGTFCDTLHGHPLMGGVDLLNQLTNEMEHFNMNRPRFVRGFILEAKKRGWTGTNILGIQNGFDYISDMGFDISSMGTRPEP